MKIAFPYLYSAEAVVGRKKNAQKLVYVDHVTADIPEVTAEQAPVAVTWKGQLNADPDRYARYFEGHFYIPASQLYRDANGFKYADLAAPERLSTPVHLYSMCEMYGYSVGSEEWHSAFKLFIGNSKDRNDTADIKELIETDQDTRRDTAEELANSLLSVDGILYRRVAEPVLVATVVNATTPNVRFSVHTGGCSYGAIVEMGAEPITVGDPANTKFFPLTERAEAMEAAGSFGLPISNDVGDIEVIYPDFVEFDQALEVASRTVEFAVESMKPIIFKFDKPTIQCWLNIRESLSEFRHSADRSIIENLMESDVPRLYDLLGSLQPAITAGIEAGLGEWGDGGTISLDVAHKAPSR